MGKPLTLLERICRHALSFGASGLAIEHKERREWIFMIAGGDSIGIADFPGSGREAKELRENLYAVEKKPLRTAAHGKVWLVRVGIHDSFGEDAFQVSFESAPKLDAATPPPFTKKQGQYLAFIYNYSKIHRRAPSEADMQDHFQVSAPSIHQMVLTLELRGFISRTPGEARSIRLLVAPEHLPRLE